MVELSKDQWDAVGQMKSGCILCGDVGSGKTRTALAFYLYKQCRGMVKSNFHNKTEEMKLPRDLYVITTAKKRDSLDWIKEASEFRISENRENSLSNVKITVDSWNNIKKYKKIMGAFFIFDEQRVVGSGAWVKAFYKITQKNAWILLSATPGDVWSDYIPVFVANRFYKNKTDFQNQHVIWSRYTTYPKIEKYYGIKKLEANKNSILVELKDRRQTHRNYNTVICEFNKELYKTVWKDRWDPYENCPIKETGKLFYLLRRVVNSDPSRINELVKLLEEIPRCIIFYNFDYELEILKEVCTNMKIPYAQWNGHAHEEIPDGLNWAYLVQYAAGAEGWNCITTDSMIFYSQNYSYKMTEQAAGRIDRMNTKYKELYYYTIRSYSSIDIAIKRALAQKRNFNESKFLKNSQK